VGVATFIMPQRLSFDFLMDEGHCQTVDRCLGEWDKVLTRAGFLSVFSAPQCH
jgi:hypothetical protein